MPRNKITLLALTLAMVLFLAPTQASATDFDGYPCPGDDCSGHRAGYAWARQKKITDADDCDGRTEAFIEGCRAYVAGGPGRVTRDSTRKREE